MPDRPPMPVAFRGARLIDPIRGIDEVGDLFVSDGIIVDAAPDGAASFDASALMLCPGLVDIHVHLREPGGEHKETIATGCAAAAAGGFTSVACMPNTNPPIDSPPVIQQVLNQARKAAGCHVLPVAAITAGRAGREVANLDKLRQAGAVAFSDDGDGVEDDAVMRQALLAARAADATLIQHCEFKHLSAGGVLHAGPTAEALGLPGQDPASETAMIERDLQLLRETGGRYHVAHVSTARSVELIRSAKSEGLAVTAEVCPHHLLLTDEACADADPDFKMAPPLRTKDDVAACRAGVLDGTIDCLVTDHAPHTAEEKAVGFRSAPFGIVGLETIVALLGTELVGTGLLDWRGLITRLMCNPLSVLGLPARTLSAGEVADLTLIEPEGQWVISPDCFRSKSRNTPFGGRRVTVRPVATMLAGRFAHLDTENAGRLSGRK